MGVVNTAIGFIQGLWNGLKAVGNGVADDLVTIFTRGADGVAQVWSNIVSDVSTNIKKIANYALKSVNWLIDQVNKIP